MVLSTRVTDVEIPGIEILQEIGRGAYSVVYRGQRGSTPVAVKLQLPAADESVTRAATAGLRREAAFLGRVKHPALPHVMETGEINSLVYLVMELVEGPTLASVLASGPLPVPVVADLAKTLAGALAELHRHGLVHRDVKPQNVILQGHDGGNIHGRENGQSAGSGAKLIDFGFATRSAAEQVPSGRADSVTGTILYAAPEQTGMLKRPVDGRSDLYALGALLFECAAGHPPFQAEDAGELIRLHAMQPVPDILAQNATFSPALAAIIQKLLAKDPDDRYQTGGGLLRDLNRLARLDALMRAGEDAPLGVTDRAARAHDETPLIGRDEALVRLYEQWSRAAYGHGTVAFIRGEPGAGKTRLAWEVLRRAREDGAIVLAGRCTEQEVLPLAPFGEVIEGWLRQMRQQPRSERESAEARTIALAGEGAPLLKRLSPNLAALLRDQPDVPASTGIEQFHEAVADFLLRMVAEAPLGAALFLDDVQWMGDAARAVLRRIVRQMGETRLLVICASTGAMLHGGREPAQTRTAPVSQRHAGHTGAQRAQTLPGETPFLDALLGDMRPTCGVEISLGPLAKRDLAQLIHAYLGDRHVEESLVERITSLSNGNPFAVVEYLRTMLDEGLLRPHWGTWVVDAASVAQVHLPPTVNQLLLLRVAQLSAPARDVLAAASILGRQFGLQALATVSSAPLPALHQAVAEATNARLIERRGTGEYVIVHDSVREALQSRLTLDQLQTLHQRAAEMLDALAPDEGQSDAPALPADPEDVYRLARHYALGQVARHPQRVFATNWQAGAVALANFADEEAYSFLTTAQRVAAEFGLPVDPELLEALGVVCVRSGKWEDAVCFLTQALDQTTDGIRRARIRTQLAQVHYSNREFTVAWREVEVAFKELELPVRQFLPIDLLYTLCCWVGGLLPAQVRVGYGTAKGRERERLRAAIDLYSIGAHIAFMDHRAPQMVRLLVQALWPARRLGPSPELVTALAGYTMMLATVGARHLAWRSARRAVQVARRVGDEASLARALGGQAWTWHVGGSPREGGDLMRRCLQEHGRWLAARDYLTASTDLSWNLLMRGHCQEAWLWTQRALHRAQHTHRLGENLASNAASLLTILGEHQQAEQYLDRARQLAEAAPENRWRWADLLGRKMLIHLERDDLGTALDDTIRRHRALGLRPQRVAFHMRHFYIFQAYALLTRYMRQRTVGEPTSADMSETRQGRQDSLDDLKASVAQLRLLSGHATFRCHRLVVEAGLERLRGAYATAKRLLEEAEQLARDTDNPWASFEIARQRAHLSRVTGESTAVEAQVKEALRLATEHGWLNRVRWIRVEFPDYAAPGAGRNHLGPAGYSELPATLPTTSAFIAPDVRRLQRHHQALLQVSLTMAAAMDAAHLARVALDQVVRILGAERGHLFLCPEQSEELVHAAGRDAAQRDLDELQGYSRSVLETVRVTRQPVVMTSAEEGPLHTSQSIIAHDLRSVVAVPLLMPGRLVGALYLDSRVASGVFGKEDLEILTAIASHIAVTVTVAQAFAKQTTLAEENEQLLARLSQQVDELQASRQRITEAEERQRREISELLHGQVQAKLLLVSHRLGDYTRLAASDPSAAAALVAAVRSEIDNIRENEVRRASHLLHPSIIRLGLGAALHLLAERFDPQFRVTVDVDPSVATLDDPLENQLPESLRLVAYRVVEEALGNAAKHSGASRVMVRLTTGTHVDIPLAVSETRERTVLDEPEASRYLVVTVSDDGHGFDVTRLRPGLGLNSLGDRVDQAGGKWRITSWPGNGTSIAAWLPLIVIETEANAGVPTANLAGFLVDT